MNNLSTLLAPCASPWETPDDLSAQSMQSLHHNLLRHHKPWNLYAWASLGVISEPRSLQQGMLLAGLGRPSPVNTPSISRSFVVGCHRRTKNSVRLQNIGTNTANYTRVFPRVQVLSQSVVLPNLFRYIISDGLDAIAVYSREDLFPCDLRFYSCMLDVVELPHDFRVNAKEGRYPGKIVTAKYFTEKGMQGELVGMPFVSDFVNDWRAFCSHDIARLDNVIKLTIHACIIESRAIPAAKCCAIRVFDGIDATWLIISDVRFDCFLHLRNDVVAKHMRDKAALFVSLGVERMSEIEKSSCWHAVLMDKENPFPQDTETVYVVRNLECVDGIGGHGGFFIDDDDFPLVDRYVTKNDKINVQGVFDSPDIMAVIMTHMTPFDVARMSLTCWGLCVRSAVWNPAIRQDEDALLSKAAYSTDVAGFVRGGPDTMKDTIYTRMHHSVTVQAMKVSRGFSWADNGFAWTDIKRNGVITGDKLNKAMWAIQHKFQGDAKDEDDEDMSTMSCLVTAVSNDNVISSTPIDLYVDSDDMSDFESDVFSHDEQRMTALFRRNNKVIPPHLTSSTREEFVGFVGMEEGNKHSVSLQRFTAFPDKEAVVDWKDMAKLVTSVSPIAIGVLRFVECSVVFNIKKNYCNERFIQTGLSCDAERYVDIDNDKNATFDSKKTHKGIFVLWQAQVANCKHMMNWRERERPRGYGDHMVFFEAKAASGAADVGQKTADWEVKAAFWEQAIIGYSKYSSLQEGSYNSADTNKKQEDRQFPFFDDDHFCVWIHDCDRIAPVVVSRAQWLPVCTFINDLKVTSGRPDVDFGVTVSMELFAPSISVDRDTKSVITSLHAKQFRVHGVIPSPSGKLFDYHSSQISNTTQLKTFLTHKKFKSAAKTKKAMLALNAQEDPEID